MSPSQTVGPGSLEEDMSFERGAGGIAQEKNHNMSGERTRVGVKGRQKSDWNDLTVDDEELRLGKD